MAKTQRISEKFSCSKVSGWVIISKVLYLFKDSTHGAPIRKTPTKIHCDNQDTCGVRQQDGIYDWTKCVHPEMRRSQDSDDK